MKPLRLIVALGLALSLGACAGMQPVARNSLPDTTSLPSATSPDAGVVQAVQPVVLMPQYDVAEIRVTVPQDLRVSEANVFYPIADIVWRGEPRGDRYAQVKAIFDESFAAGTAGMTQGPKVIVEAEVTRFHCLTEKTRFTFGGVHSLKFILTVRDAATGQIIDGPRKVVADVKASGGSRAMAEEAVGRTQRVVIVEDLTRVIQRELMAERPVPALDAVPTSRLESNLILSPLALTD